MELRCAAEDNVIYNQRRGCRQSAVFSNQRQRHIVDQFMVSLKGLGRRRPDVCLEMRHVFLTEFSSKVLFCGEADDGG